MLIELHIFAILIKKTKIMKKENNIKSISKEDLEKFLSSSDTYINSLEKQLKEKDKQFKDLHDKGCRTSIVMGNLKSQIGELKVRIARLELQESIDKLVELEKNYTPMITNH